MSTPRASTAPRAVPVDTADASAPAVPPASSARRSRPGTIGVSRLEELRNDLVRARSELQKAQKLSAIGGLATGVAHEINTPVQYVTDNVVFLQRSFEQLLTAARTLRPLLDKHEDELPPEARVAIRKVKLDYLERQVPRAIEQSLDGLHRVASIVAAMKEFAHPSSGEREPIDLRRALESTVTLARNEWKYFAECSVEVDPSLPAVPCYADELNQVLLNLLVNAVHAVQERREAQGTDALGHITLRAVQVGDFAEIRVVDDGAGIPEAIRAKIFEPFFTTKPVGKGTGQGLAIAWSIIVEKHGGTIDVESTVGVGTTFVLRIPMSFRTTEGGPA